MRVVHIAPILASCLLALPVAADEPPPVSEATETCLICHESLHPGIVAGWRSSRHAAITPAAATAVQGLSRKVSSDDIPGELTGVVVGCAECHTLRPDQHEGVFDHNDYRVHSVVSPGDCAVCHPVEAEQYAGNIMAHAHGNLEGNALYQDLKRNILGEPVRDGGRLVFQKPNPETDALGCLYCHGTRLEVTGIETRETDFGEMEFAAIAGWPNQGVGRVNLDGTLGSCSACHTRHSFAIEIARKPYTCKECHVGPDVPVYKVYSASKHGNIYHSKKQEWDFSAVPWTVGRDFTAPTCAACHVSLLVSPEGETIAERTHGMNGRIAWRIFGLVYSHAHPKDPDTTKIRNKDGMPLPTALDGTPASEFLIDAGEQARRRKTMSAICLSCHGEAWVRGHFDRYERSHETTNAATITATQILQEAWERGLAEGPAAGGSPFDEAIEHRWADVWLFYANSIRFTAAMAGGGDYAVFADGHYTLSKRIKEMQEWLEERVQPER
jgi:hydroxylamine dehydrogenase